MDDEEILRWLRERQGSRIGRTPIGWGTPAEYAEAAARLTAYLDRRWAELSAAYECEERTSEVMLERAGPDGNLRSRGTHTCAR